MRTTTPGTSWPAIVSPKAAVLLSMQYQFEKGEYMTGDWVRRQQFKRADFLLRYAIANVPYYRRAIPHSLAENAITPDRWNEVPILTREQLQTAGETILSERLPKGHGPISKISTSGSTGMPVTAYGSAITRLIWLAIDFRYQIWRNTDWRCKLAAIRPDSELPPGESKVHASWGPPASVVVKTGPGASLNIRTPLEQQIEWLRRERPGYLHTMPTNLRSILNSGLELDSLRGVSTFGEMLDEQTTELCRSQWGVSIADVYSTQEVGNIAIQCPQRSAYHVQAESVLVEIVDEDGRLCDVGQPGRVLVTTLQNLASPLIRYAIGDYAALGPACSCGRGLPVIKKIQGRRRNMLVMPNGDRHWPSFPVKTWAADLPVKQFQFVQKSVDLIEARLVVKKSLTDVQTQAMKQRLIKRFGYPVEIAIHYQDQIERSKSGKYEDFVSEVAS